MPKINIRPSIAADLDQILTIERNYTTEYTWQLNIQSDEDQNLGVSFHKVRLPRQMRVEYPRSTQTILEEWGRCSGILIGTIDNAIVGYITLSLNIIPRTTWVTDLVVQRHLRRQGIGSALVLAAQDWGLEKGSAQMVLEMQSRNNPAIQMARKLGFNFCGFQDLYYANRDVAIFYSRSLH